MSDVACELRVFSASERQAHLDLTKTLFAACEVVETSNGVRLRFSSRVGVVAELGNFIEHERRCCAFFRFELFVERELVVLELSGPSEARNAMMAALELARTGEPPESLPERITERTGFTFNR